MWDILKDNIVSVSYTPVLVNLAGLFSQCSSFAFWICRIYRERKLQPAAQSTTQNKDISSKETGCIKGRLWHRLGGQSYSGVSCT